MREEREKQKQIKRIKSRVEYWESLAREESLADFLTAMNKQRGMDSNRREGFIS